MSSSRTKKLLVFALLLVGGLLYATAVTHAQYLGFDVGEQTGLGKADLRFTAATIIRTALRVLGIVDLVIIIYAGFSWMTAGGNDEKIGEAKKWLYGSVIGLAIILASYSIMTFVVQYLVEATVTPTGYEPGGFSWHP